MTREKEILYTIKGDAIRKKRKDMGLTQAQVTAHTNMCSSTIMHIENDFPEYVSLHKVGILCKFLGIPVEDVVEFKGHRLEFIRQLKNIHKKEIYEELKINTYKYERILIYDEELKSYLPQLCDVLSCTPQEIFGEKISSCDVEKFEKRKFEEKRDYTNAAKKLVELIKAYKERVGIAC